MIYYGKIILIQPPNCAFWGYQGDCWFCFLSTFSLWPHSQRYWKGGQFHACYALIWSLCTRFLILSVCCWFLHNKNSTFHCRLNYSICRLILGKVKFLRLFGSVPHAMVDSFVHTSHGFLVSRSGQVCIFEWRVIEGSIKNIDSLSLFEFSPWFFLHRLSHFISIVAFVQIINIASLCVLFLVPWSPLCSLIFILWSILLFPVSF